MANSGGKQRKETAQENTEGDRGGKQRRETEEGNGGWKQ